MWGNVLEQLLFLVVTLSSGQVEWSALSDNHSFKVHSCEKFRRMVRFGGWYRIVISKGNGQDNHSLGHNHSLKATL
jgi:hypothetical protein